MSSSALGLLVVPKGSLIIGCCSDDELDQMTTNLIYKLSYSHPELKLTVVRWVQYYAALNTLLCWLVAEFRLPGNGQEPHWWAERRELPVIG